MDTGVAAWRCCHLRAVYIFLPNTTTEHYGSIVLSSGANRGALLRHAKIQVVSTAAKKKVKKNTNFFGKKNYVQCGSCKCRRHVSYFLLTIVGHLINYCCAKSKPKTNLANLVENSVCHGFFWVFKKRIMGCFLLNRCSIFQVWRSRSGSEHCRQIRL